MSDHNDERSTSDGVGNVAVEPLAQRLCQHWQGALAPQVNAALEAADDALFQRAEREETDTAQDQYFSAMRELRLQRQAVQERFAATLEQSLKQALGVDDPNAHYNALASAGGTETWSLMDRDEVEEEVAIDATASRLRGRVSSVLADIDERLSRLVPRSGDGDANPLDPVAVVEAFACALRAVGISIQARIIVYKLLERELLTSLADAYERLNTELAAAGLTAERDESAADDSADTAEEEAADPDGGANSAAGAGRPTPLEELPPEQEVVGLLHRLIAAARRESAPNSAATTSGSHGAAPADTDAGDGDQAADGRVVAGVLSALQRSAAQRQSSALDADQLKMLVGRGLARQRSGGELDRSSDQTIDIVSMLFEVILEDERLAGAIKALFARLQIPVLKVALRDQSFFADSGHPARRLFNTLARAALAWQPTEQPEDDPVYQNIRAAVGQVVERFSDDPQVFEAARQDFERWQQEIAATRQGAHASGKERVEATKQEVHDIIESRLSGEPDAPDVLSRLLREAWFKVLFITAVKQGVASDAWHRHVAVMDRLIWSMRPKTEPRERQQMLDDLPELLKDIRDGLNSIMYNPAAMNRFFHELQAAHLRILEQPADAPVDSEHVVGKRDPAERLTGSPLASPAPNAAEGATDGSNVVSALFGGDRASADGGATGGPPEADTEDADIARELRAIADGSWFEFLDDAGGRTRACLHSRSSDGQRYIFANQRGERTAQYTLGELSRLIAAGEAAPVDDEALFDRAIESVIAQLQQQAG